MNALIRVVTSPEEITVAADRLREAVSATEDTPGAILDVLEAWGVVIGEAETAEIPGVAFLRLWLRRSTLGPIIQRELGRGVLDGGWTADGQARLKAYPVGVVCHWPAGNIDIQPILSLTCALLGGNASIVRVPAGLREQVHRLMEKLLQVDKDELLTKRIFMPIFDHSRQDLHEAMARAADGAMVWGGEEAVSRIRSLSFPHWARLAVFGPRISLAVMDADSWCDAGTREMWCRRIAREVWQFDQQACSSPQVIFLENREQHSATEFVQALKRAFESENDHHPRQEIQAALTSAICKARASWLLDKAANSAIFPKGPDWTILLGQGTEIPRPTQGKTLTVLVVDELLDVLEKLDGNVQTLGLAMADAEKEKKFASVAARRGVDRIVKLGHMHVFGAPWDGVDLIRPMVRMVRHVGSTDLVANGVC
jgi:Acyl-CoA reductase (LuxC)